MADLSDVLNALVTICDQAIYPGGDPGFAMPSPVTGAVTKIYPGWPQAEQLDADLAQIAAAQPQTIVHVSVFSPGGSGAGAAQVFELPQVISPPVHTLFPSAIVNPTGFGLNKITVTGTPYAGEYLTFVLTGGEGQFSYSYVALATDTAATMLTNLAAQITVNFPGCTATGNVISITGAAYITVRVGAPATTGQAIHRQKHLIRVTVWAPTPASRDATCQILGPALTFPLTITLADTSQGILIYESTMVDDMPQKANMYRRDLCFSCTYATVHLSTVFEITSVNIQIDPQLPEDRITTVVQ